MGILANKIITGNQLVYEKPEEVKLPPKTGSKITAGRIVTGAQVVYEEPPKQPKYDGIVLRSLSELRTSDKVEIRENDDGNKEIVPVDKRLSSYFLVQKESDYLDHNKKLNRR